MSASTADPRFAIPGDIDTVTDESRYRTDIAWSAPDSITVLGHDLPNELLGKIGFGDMAFLMVTHRLPSVDESRMFNAMLVTLVEHGLTPSTIAARMTIIGAPEALQAAVAAGLCGPGSVFVGSIEGTAKMLYDVMPQPDVQSDLQALATKVLDGFEQTKAIVPGIGHPFHKPIDPRAPRLLQIAAATGFAGPYVQLIQAISAAAEQRKGKPLPVNATGVLGALCCEMGFEWRLGRGLGVMARAVGLVGHILEEARQPMARRLWLDTEAEATQHFKK
jgi:citrate synthase